MSIRFAIGKNSTEGRTHMMCIEGTEGEQRHPPPALPTALAWAGGIPNPPCISVQAVRIPSRASQS